jgi:Tfp pilus assembly protein PilX
VNVGGANRDAGAALVLTLLVTVLLAALGRGLITLGDTEAALAHNHRAAGEVRYAADAALERALAEIGSVASWTDLLTGLARSPLHASSTTPATPWGTPLDLAALTIELQAASDAVAAWALNNPSWRVYASGSLDAAAGSILPAAAAYLVVWVADDPSETDNNPAADTNEVVLLHSLAVNGLGMRSVAQVTAQRTAGVIRILAWRRVR